MSTPAVTVSTSTTTTKVSPNIRFDPKYIKTLPGLLKIAQVLLSLAGFICIQSIPFGIYKSAGGWFAFVSMTAFWVTLILIVAYVFHIVERLHFIPWIMGEGIFAVAWAIFFFIAACVAAANGKVDPGFAAAAFFGFAAMGVYGFEAYQRYMQYKGGEIAQGERTTSSSAETTAPTGPSYPTY